MLYFILLIERQSCKQNYKGEHLINELKLNVNENCNASMHYKNTMESKEAAHSLINVNL